MLCIVISCLAAEWTMFYLPLWVFGSRYWQVCLLLLVSWCWPQPAAHLVQHSITVLFKFTDPRNYCGTWAWTRKITVALGKSRVKYKGVSCASGESNPGQYRGRVLWYHYTRCACRDAASHLTIQSLMLIVCFTRKS